MIYFDMDGVLADFSRGVQELCHMEPSNLNNPNEAHDNLMWKKIQEIGDFYYQLKPMPGTVELFQKLNRLSPGSVQILTAVPKPKRGIITAGEDKRRWVEKYLGKDIAVNIVLKEEKKNFVKDKDCILIDDLEKNIREWEECGGTGILFQDAEQVVKRLREICILPGYGGDAAFLIRKDTQVIFRIGDSPRYFMTNEPGKVTEMTRVFCSTLEGEVEMNGYLLGSIYAHDPYLIPSLKKIDKKFAELNPDYFAE